MKTSMLITVKKMNPEIIANFHKWMKLYYIDKIQFNPTIIEIKEGCIIFGMYKHMGRLSVSIEKINLDLEI
jgi:hypothetical protein